MGYELRRKLRVALGPDITGLQRAVALEIADDAREDTRKSWATLEDLACWTGAKDSSVVRNALKRLAAAGWEFRIPIGKGKDGRALYAVPGTRMTFQVPPFEEVATAPSSDLKGEPPLPQEGAGATPSIPQGGAGAHSEGAVAPSEGAVAPPFSSYPSAPQEEEASSAQGGAVATPSLPALVGSATNSQQQPEDLRDFGDFWLLHPKSRDQDDTLKAWRAAVASGVDPKKITAAAKAYAHEVAGEPIKFIKLSANWLRDKRYNDRFQAGPELEPGKPNLRAVPDNLSTADKRVAQGQALAAMFREQEQRALEAAPAKPQERA